MGQQNSESGRKGRILFVEDEDQILRLGKRMLESLGYEVITAGAPADALDLVKKEEPAVDLLLTDVVMPEMTGVDLAETLEETYPDLKVIFISGYSDQVISEDGVVSKGLNFLQKPFSKEDLSKKIQEVLQG